MTSFLQLEKFIFDKKQSNQFGMCVVFISNDVISRFTQWYFFVMKIEAKACFVSLRYAKSL